MWLGELLDELDIEDTGWNLLGAQDVPVLVTDGHDIFTIDSISKKKFERPKGDDGPHRYIMVMSISDASPEEEAADVIMYVKGLKK